MMARFLNLAIGLGAALALAAPAFAQPAAARPPLSFDAAEQACEAGVRAKLPGGKSGLDAVDTLEAELRQGPCTEPALGGRAPDELIAAVEQEVRARHGQYGCADQPDRPVCAGLAGVAARAQALRAAAAGGGSIQEAAARDATGLIHATNALSWNENFMSFGGSRTLGVSLLRLTLMATDADGRAVAAQVWADTRYDTFKESFVTSGAAARVSCDAQCGEEAAHVIALYPLFAALKQSTAGWDVRIFDERRKQFERKEKLWNAYHFGGGEQRTQLYWELLLNGAIFRSQHPKLNSETAPIDEFFPDPPNYAVTFMHPSVGLSLKTPSGADSSLVGVVELLGISRWKYSDEGEREGEWGASAIAAYQPRDDGADWGYGVLVRLPWRSVNVAWTHTDLEGGKNDDQVLLSLDLSKYLAAGDVPCIFGLPSCKE